MKTSNSQNSKNPPYRKNFTTYGQWYKQAKKYVRRTAPPAHRIFIRHSEPGLTWRRFVIPGSFVLIGIMLLWGGWLSQHRYALLTGADGHTDTLQVIEIDQKSRSNQGRAHKKPVYLTAELQDGRSQRVLGSYDTRDVEGIAVGDQVRFFYADGAEPIVMWAGDDIAPSNGAATGLLLFGSIVIVGALLMAKYYKGAPSNIYRAYALSELESNRTPKDAPEKEL